MVKRSAGLLLYRSGSAGIEVLLVHPGGPFWAKRDDGAWSIPKGEYEPDEDPHEVALREFGEELGKPLPSDGPFTPLGELRQKSGKLVTTWAVEADLDVDEVHSNTFMTEWPRGSGAMREFPEVDRAGWFDLEAARAKLLSGQVGFLDRLETTLADPDH
jgi:predicted NUDIX family NTP pyrophosphohydrolase